MISVIIPALNEAKTICELIRFARGSDRVSEVIVVDDGSIDGTPEIAKQAGARVIRSTLLGKGASMEDGMRAASSELVVYLDGDLTGLDSQLVSKLTAPLLAQEADFVKAKFSRSSGRVTALTARPLLQVFFPELASIDQPLGGIVAARKSLLMELRFESDYGADVGLLIDAWACGARIAEVEIGRIEHDSQPLNRLGEMAEQVVRTIFERATTYERFCPRQVREVREVKHRTQAEMEVVLGKVGQPDRIALVDMDGTLLQGRFVVELAHRLGKYDQLCQFLDHPTLGAAERTHDIAAIFSGASRECIEETAHAARLVEGAGDLVVGLRKAGYRVGVVTDSYHIAADIVRRRVFADFTVAHVMKMRDDVATGELVLSPAMFHEHGCKSHSFCKANVLLHLSERTGVAISDFLAIGDGLNDVCMLRNAGTSFAVNTMLTEVRAAAQHTVAGCLTQILSHLQLVAQKKHRATKPRVIIHTKIDPICDERGGSPLNNSASA